MKSLEFLKSKGIKFKTIELKEMPRSAQDVEQLYGCPLSQILQNVRHAAFAHIGLFCAKR